MTTRILGVNLRFLLLLNIADDRACFTFKNRKRRILDTSRDDDFTDARS